MQSGFKYRIEKVVLNMLKKGISIKDISNFTGFSTEYIQNLVQKDKK